MYKGSTVYPLSEQLRDNIATHGLAWTLAYCAKRKLPIEVLLVLLRGQGMLGQPGST